MLYILVVVTVFILIALNGFFVAAEIGTVGARRARIAQEAAAGSRPAQILLPILESPDRLDDYIAACQLGITLSSLMLGYYGKAVITPLVEPLLVGSGIVAQAAAVSIAATGVLVVLTVIQVALSELAPKTVAIQFPEPTSLLLVTSVNWAIILLRPLIWFFNGSGRLLLRLVGLRAVSEGFHIHAPEEILMMVQESGAGGVLKEGETELLENTLQLRRRSLRHVIVPRTQLLAAPVDLSTAELLQLLAESTHSRLPLYEGTVDNIVGVVHLKDLLCMQARPDSERAGDPDRQSGQNNNVRDVMRVPPYVPESASVLNVFRQLQTEHFHLAVVIDEYGGTAGIVTFEDLIEEIFGDIADEFDADSQEMALANDGRLNLAGEIDLESLSEFLGSDLEFEDVDTLGGAILAQLGAIPEQGQVVRLQEFDFQVEEVSGYAVTRVSVALPPGAVAKLPRSGTQTE
ncbi:MAG: hemolysin family protein [Caldilineaceae bacterium]|nr:hemolysin family protein [Caldilineaceae bacterium]